MCFTLPRLSSYLDLCNRLHKCLENSKRTLMCVFFFQFLIIFLKLSMNSISTFIQYIFLAFILIFLVSPLILTYFSLHFILDSKQYFSNKSLFHKYKFIIYPLRFFLIRSRYVSLLER